MFIRSTKKPEEAMAAAMAAAKAVVPVAMKAAAEIDKKIELGHNEEQVPARPPGRVARFLGLE